MAALKAKILKYAQSTIQENKDLQKITAKLEEARNQARARENTELAEKAELADWIETIIEKMTIKTASENEKKQKKH